MQEDQDEISVVGLLRPLWSHRRLIVVGTFAMTVFAVVVAVVHYEAQPVRWTAAVEFRPVFDGAAMGKYPNGLAFAASDVTDRSVLDEVYERNKLQDLCSQDDYHSAFFVEQQSSELQTIDADFQSQLADPKLTAVDRQKLMDQYHAKRASAAVQYRLTFIRPPACQAMPAVVVNKVLDEILLTWADHSENKRGVLKQRVDILTPSVLDISTGPHESLFVRANLLWTNLDRIIHNISVVDALPGAGLVRLGKDQVSLAELKARLEDLQHARLEATMSAMGDVRDRQDVQWVENALATATSQQQIAQDRARASLDALREYSGTSPLQALKKETASGGGETTQLVDRGFIEQIMQMSELSTNFKQQLTLDVVKASLDAVEFESAVNHYKQLLVSLRTEGSGRASADLDMELKSIATAGQELTRQFNDIYAAWSVAAFRPGPSLYRTVTPASSRVVHPFTLSMYLAAVAVVFFATLAVLSLAALVHTQLWPRIIAKVG